MAAAGFLLLLSYLADSAASIKSALSEIVLMLCFSYGIDWSACRKLHQQHSQGVGREGGAGHKKIRGWSGICGHGHIGD